MIPNIGPVHWHIPLAPLLLFKRVPPSPSGKEEKNNSRWDKGVVPIGTHWFDGLLNCFHFFKTLRIRADFVTWKHHIAPSGAQRGFRHSRFDLTSWAGVGISQAHWNFARCLVEGDPQAAPSESMPSLKSMVKPFAWEKLKATVQRSLALCSSSSLQ